MENYNKKIARGVLLPNTCICCVWCAAGYTHNSLKLIYALKQTIF